MSAKQLATFHVGGLFFGVDVARVQEVVRYEGATRVPLAPPSVAGLLNMRGQVVTAVDMRVRAGVEGERDGEPMSVVVRLEGEVVSLLVDTIGDVVSVTDDQFELPPDTLGADERELITGAYKLEGELLLVLDVEKTLAVPA